MLQNAVPLRIHLKKFLEALEKIDKDVNTMFRAVDGILERMNEKLTKLENSDNKLCRGNASWRRLLVHTFSELDRAYSCCRIKRIAGGWSCQVN